ncbi:MAG: trypsin-like peptidase domain-containing protein [Actinobacteria bacterium]|nr:trypsin-like peptidase domain-containing protein [Actinomycetota bacterium]
MRPGSTVAVALLAAVIGGATVLALGKAAGWTGDRRTETVVVAPPAVDERTNSTTPTGPRASGGTRAKPLSELVFNPARTYADRSAGVVTIYATFGSGALEPESQGSGFVASPKGYILTNAHVITSSSGPDRARRASRLYVEFEDGDRIAGTIVGWDIFNDIGLVKVSPQAHPLRPVPLGDSANVTVGEPVSAIGSPFGNQNTLTVGVVSSTGRSITSLASDYRIVDAIQTDAPINHGNSGGPLFNARGEAIGINAQIRSTSGLNQGVGFAIPINTARRAMDQIVATGRVSYAYVGVSTDDLTPTLARHFRYRADYGAVVACVTPGSPGDRSGLRGGNRQAFNGRQFVEGGDVIVAIDNQPVRAGEDVARIITERLRPGEVATFRVVRGTERRTVSVKLAERPTEPSSAC